ASWNAEPPDGLARITGRAASTASCASFSFALTVVRTSGALQTGVPPGAHGGSASYWITASAATVTSCSAPARTLIGDGAPPEHAIKTHARRPPKVKATGARKRSLLSLSK